MADRPVFQRTTHTVKALAALSTVEVGGTITWGQLSFAIGLEARAHGEGNCYVWSARRILVAEQGKVFGAVPGVGLRLLAPDEVVGRGSHRRKKIRNQTRYCLDEYATVEDQIDALTDEARMEYLGNRALMESLRQASSHHAAQRAVREAMESQPPPQAPSDLSAFANS